MANPYWENLVDLYNIDGKDVIVLAEGRLVNYRDTYNDNDRRKIWEDQRSRSRNRRNKELNKTLALIIIILIFIFLYIIDFDLSIFYNN